MLGLHNFDVAVSSVYSVFHKSKKKGSDKSCSILYHVKGKNLEVASILVKLFCHFSTQSTDMLSGFIKQVKDLGREERFEEVFSNTVKYFQDCLYQ